MNRKKWLQKIATFMLAGTLILQPVSLSSMNLMPLTVAAAESGKQDEAEKEEEKKTLDEGKTSDEKKDSAAGKDTDNKKSDDSGQSSESVRKSESDSADQTNEDKKQSSSDVKNEDKEKKEENKEKETGTENKEEEEKKEETEKEKEEKQKDKDEKKTEKEDKKEDKEEKEKNAREKKTEENDSAVDAENAAKDAGQDHKKEENKEEEENQNSDKTEKAADDGKTGENTTDTAESQNALERLGETLDKTILQAPLLRGNGKKKLKIIIIPEDKHIDYDGDEHIVQNFTVKYQVDGGDETETKPEGVSVKLKDNKITRETNAGEYEFSLKSGDFEITTSDNYNSNNGNGNGIEIRAEENKKYKLYITRVKCSVTIIGNTASLPYNGKEQSVSGYTIELPEGAPIGEGDISGPEQSAAVATGKDVKYENGNVVSYPMGLTDSDFATSNENYDVTFVVEDGWLKIKPLGITLITGSDSKEYDGTPLTLDLLSPQLINEEPGADLNTFFGEAEPVTVTGSRTDVGSSDNTCQITWKDGATPDNYNIKYNLGKLVVTPKHVTITAKDASKEYDGSALTESGITVEGLADTDTHTFKVEMTSDSAITNPGTKSNVIGTVDGVAVEQGKETAVGNYLVTVKNGTLTITGDGPKPTPTGDDDPKPSAQKDENQTPGDDNPPRDGGDNTGSGTGTNGSGTGNGGNTNAGGGTTGGGNNDGTNTNTGGNGAAAANAAAAPAATPTASAVTPPATPAAPAVTDVPDNQVPQAAPEEVTIDDEPAPLAAPEDAAVDEEKASAQEEPVYWALFNLLMAVGSVLLGAGKLAAYFADRDKKDGDNNDEEGLSEDERKRRGQYRLACAAPAAASLIAFFLTEDLSRQMHMIDKWTPLMVVFLAATAVLAFLSGKKKDES